MGDEVEPWALEWLAAMRAEGRKGISVENRGGVHQLRWQTTEWDRERKKRVKRTNYIGTLEYPGHIVLAKGLDVAGLDPRAREAFGLEIKAPKQIVLCDQKVRGPMMLIRTVCGNTLDRLRQAFGNALADDLWMLAMARLFGQGRLVRAGRWYSTMENVHCLNYDTDPEVLSEVLRKTGMSSLAQANFFESLTEPGMKMAADMTVVFSRSKGAFLIKRGYNRFKLTTGQFNVVVICSLGDCLPIAMKTVAGNVREGCLQGMLKEFDIGDDVIVVMDRGYDIDELREVFDDSGKFFIIPVTRDSVLYDTVRAEEGAFVYKGQSIRFGAGDGFGFNAFRYENMELRNNEVKSAIEDAGGILMGPLPEEAGNLILLTNLNETAESIYRIFKTRCSVENVFDTGKTLLNMDSSYMHDSYHIQGFNFVTFLTLRIRTEVDNLMTSVKLDPKLTVEDVLFIYSNSTITKTSDGEILEYVPADLRGLDQKLGLGLYPKNRELELKLGWMLIV